MENDVTNNKSKLATNSTKKCVKTKIGPDETEAVESIMAEGNGEAQLDQSVVVICKDVSTIDLSETNGCEIGAVDKESAGDATTEEVAGEGNAIADADKKESMNTPEVKIASNDVLILEINDNLDAYLEKQRSNAGAKIEETCEAQIEDKSTIESNEAISDVDVEGAKCESVCADIVKSDDKAEIEKNRAEKKKSSKSKATKSKNDPIALKRESDKDESVKKKIKIDNDATPNAQEGHASGTGDEVKVKIEKDDAKKETKVEEKKSESRCVWIYDLSQSTKASNMRVHLSQHGKVAMAKIVTDGKQFYGYVLMEKREDVENCIKNLNETVFEGRKIRVSDKGPKNSDKDVDKVAREGDEVDKIDKIEKSDETRPKRGKVELKPRRVLENNRDPLTLKIDSQKSDRYSEERKRRRVDEVQLREKTLRERREMMMRRERQERELEREREERRRQRIRDEEKRQFVMKVDRERRRLDQERHLIEKEKYELLRLQKKLADTERSMLNRQKLEVERSLRNISEEFKKPRSPGYDRKAGASSGASTGKGYWKNDKISSPLKPKAIGFNVDYSKKVARDDGLCAPPPPILTDNFDLSSRVRKVEKERGWECRKDYSARPAFKDGKGFERKNEDNRNYSYGDRRDFPDKTYVKERYKPKDSTKFDKSHSNNAWDKASQMQYKNSSSTNWSNNRPAPRYQPQSFIAPHFVQNPGVAHCYPGPAYGRSADVYGRSPERKY